MNILKNQQEKDAIFAALTALFYKEGNYSQFGDLEEGLIILPKLET
jgi:predicted nuclease with RNAse H fold